MGASAGAIGELSVPGGEGLSQVADSGGVDAILSPVLGVESFDGIEGVEKGCDAEAGVLGGGEFQESLGSVCVE
jgi:hypothetical protein